MFAATPDVVLYVLNAMVIVFAVAIAAMVIGGVYRLFFTPNDPAEVPATGLTRSRR